MSIFDYLEDFNPGEKWGEPEKINGLLLMLLQQIRDITGWKMLILNGYAESGHTKGSQHYIGNAVDFRFIFPNQGEMERPRFHDQIEKLEMILEILQVEDRVGLGVYPDWHVGPGFHLDVRGSMARWSGFYKLERLTNGKMKRKQYYKSGIEPGKERARLLNN